MITQDNIKKLRNSIPTIALIIVIQSSKPPAKLTPNTRFTPSKPPMRSTSPLYKKPIQSMPSRVQMEKKRTENMMYTSGRPKRPLSKRSIARTQYLGPYARSSGTAATSPSQHTARTGRPRCWFAIRSVATYAGMGMRGGAGGAR